MKIATRQLEGHLKRGLAPLYAVYGAEQLLALEAADAIRAAARKAGCGEREVFFAEPGADWNRLGASAANLSLFASRRLIEIRVPTGKPGTEGARAIESWCAGLAAAGEGGDVGLVMLPELDWQQVKTKWFEALERTGVAVEARPVTREELPEWLAARLARQGQRAGVETLEWLAERVEGNLLAARQEVEKLALLLPAGEITGEALREVVTDVSRFERDTLVAAIHAGDVSRIARAIESLEAGGEPLPLLLWTLTEELRAMVALAAGERPRRWMPNERLALLQASAKRHRRGSLERLLAAAHRVDRIAKGVETGDAWEAMLGLALALAAHPVLEPVNV